jgi:hypothetical protein
MSTHEKACGDCGRPMSDPGPCSDSSDPGAGHSPSKYDYAPSRALRSYVNGKLVDPEFRDSDITEAPGGAECFTLRF